MGRFLENKVLEKSKFSKNFINTNILHRNFFLKDSTNFRHRKLTLKLKILRSLKSLLIIFVSLMMSLSSEKKILISNRCNSGLMPKSINQKILEGLYETSSKLKLQNPNSENFFVPNNHSRCTMHFKYYLCR